MKIYVYSNGDSTVGDSGEYVEINWETCLEIDKESRESVRQLLYDSYVIIFDTKEVSVIFEDEKEEPDI